MTENKKRRIPHKVRGGAIYELVHMYKSPFAWVRETVANIYDQAKHPNANGRKPVARIYVSKLRKNIRIIDDLTGITDLDDFTAVGTESADRSSGKVLGDRKSSYEDIDPEIIGQKHLGKLSCMAACIEGKESTEFYSNNGRNGHYLHMDCDGWEIFEHDLPFQTIDRSDALQHTGLKVIITDVRDECLNINALVKQISKYFAILLSKKKIQIFVYDSDHNNKETEVHKPEGFETKGEITHSLLEMSRGGNVRVNLIPLDAPSLSANIDVYSKEIYIFSRKVPYLVKGYENWDGHELVITRDDVKDNTEWIEKTDRYYAHNFAPEWKLEKKKELGEKQKETLCQIIEEVCTAIHKVHPNLLVDLFGQITPFGIPGTPLINNSKKPPQGGHHEYPDNPCPVGFHRDPISGECIPVETKEPGIDDPSNDDNKLVMPQIDILDGNVEGEALTVSARVIKEMNMLQIVLDARKPASSIFRKPWSIERNRELCYDKFIAAILKLKYDRNDLEEFEKKKDEIWNSLYQEGNIIQKQTDQMIKTAKSKGSKRSRT